MSAPATSKGFLYKPLVFVLLVGGYPALALLAVNISEVNALIIMKPLLLSLGITGVFWGGVYLFVRSAVKASILTAVFQVIFFSYGHLYSLVSSMKAFPVIVGRHFTLLSLSLLIFLACALLVIRARKISPNLVFLLNLFSMALVIFPVYQIGDFFLRDYRSRQNAPEKAAQGKGIAAGNPGTLPDIYYIITDMYTRDDVLREDLAFDNQPFLSDLEDLGFYVGRCSLSNYGQTQLSLASSLNMDYLPGLGEFLPDSVDRTRLDDLIEDSAVRQYLEEKGYITVSLSAYTPLKIESASINYSTDVKDLPVELSSAAVDPFEAMFIKSTGLVILTQLPQTQDLKIIRDINYPYATHIRQQLYILDTLEKVPDIPGPKFVFVHIQIPHPPFVFGPDGELVKDPPPFPSDPTKPVSLERVYRLYVDQIKFLNARLRKILPAIINHPSTPPVIIIQGDHGVLEDRRTAVLNAYFIPGGGNNALYPRITPVNTFRVVLDHIFGTDLGLLEDMSYYSSYALPFQYQQLQDTREGCQPVR